MAGFGITDKFQEMTIDDLVRGHTQRNTITCLSGGEEMLRVSPDGFWVRGVKVAQDSNEAEAVYQAFKAWMSWAQLNRDYK
jgi:hypothetical protein